MSELTAEDIAKLPLSVHDKDGNKPTEAQLVKLAEIILGTERGNDDGVHEGNICERTKECVRRSEKWAEESRKRELLIGQSKPRF